MLTMIENKEGITEIVMRPMACTKCKIGQDWYQHKFTVYFTPGKFYPDYMQVEAWIMKYIDGQELNIEEAVDLLYDFFLRYEPKALSIEDDIKNSKTSFDVTVRKG